MKSIRMKAVAIVTALIVGPFLALSAIAGDKTWQMGTSSTGTAGYASTMGLCSLVNKYTDYKLEAIPTPGSTATARMFGKGEVDMAYQSGWGLSEIYESIGPFEDNPLPRKPYQGLYYGSFEIVVITKAGRDDITSYEDLKGKKVFPLPAAMGWHDLFKLTMQEMDIYQEIDARQMDAMQAADALKIGNVDAVVSYSTNLGTLSVSWFKNIDSLVDMKIISPTPEEQKQISALKLPGVFYGEKMSYDAISPDNAEATKEANPDGVWLWGSYQGWHPGSDMPTDVMYQMFKAWIENADEIADVNSFLQYWAKDPLEMQIKAIQSAPDIPVHPGVAKYLKEKDLWEDDWTIGKLDQGIE